MPNGLGSRSRPPFDPCRRSAAFVQLSITSRFDRVTSIWNRANPQLRNLAVYEAGKPIEETARELNVDPRDIIKLASNENPLGPSPRAIAAMRAAIGSAQLYPDSGGFYLRDALAQKLGFARENIILGNGSNEVIEFLGHAFLNPGDDIVTPAHAFIAYKLIAHLFGARITVLDEAYFEFLDDPPDTLRHVRNGRNVVILRTFSKIHGLASLRVGYGIARPELIEVLQKTRQPFNVNGVAQAGALAALGDDEHLRKSKRVVDSGRAYLENEFRAMKLKFIPSAGNFVFVNVGDGPTVFKKMLARKIIVRPLRGYNLPEWIRITVGTMEQNEKCIAVLKEVLS